MKYVFAHGWAMGDWFWQPLSHHFADGNNVYLSTPYFSVAEQWLDSNFNVDGEPWIGVGHSLGFRKLIEIANCDCLGLVSISGFLDFAQPFGTPRDVIATMQTRLKVDPTSVLQKFYRRCGLNHDVPKKKNLTLLATDLESLGCDFQRQWDLPIESIESRPTLALCGQLDRIVPNAQAKAQFGNLDCHPEAGHALGFEQAKWCADKIRSFARSL